MAKKISTSGNQNISRKDIRKPGYQDEVVARLKKLRKKMNEQEINLML